MFECVWKFLTVFIDIWEHLSVQLNIFYTPQWIESISTKEVFVSTYQSSAEDAHMILLYVIQ